MNPEIAIALISSGSSLTVAVISIIINNRLIGYKVEELKKQVEKHNELIKDVAMLQRDLKTAFTRIDENRDDIKEVRSLVANK